MIVNLKRVGKLTQAAEELPIKVKRVYWINTKGEARGGHAHRKTRQVFTCIQGSYTFVVDNGQEKKKFKLSADRPEGIHISWEWHTMEDCSDDCIILVFADMFCDESDYIRNYDQWKGLIDVISSDTSTI